MTISTMTGVFDEFAVPTAKERLDKEPPEKSFDTEKVNDPKADVPSESRANAPRIKSMEEAQDFKTSVMNFAYTGKGSVIDFMT